MDAAVRVDGDEAVHRLGKPVDRSTLKSRKRHDAVGLEAAVRDELELTVGERTRVCTDLNRTPFSSRSARIAWLAGDPNSCSGSASGVTSVSSTPCIPRA